MGYDLSIMEQGCAQLDISLDDIQKKQFTDFYEFLVGKNKVMNLTGITDFQEVLVKHFLDSLSCVKALDMKKIKSIIDVGTGAGFPGVPLKIAFPHLEYARNKDYRESFDLCVSRAVSNLATLAEYCLPYVKKGGYFISYKSGAVKEEAQQAEKAVKVLGGKIKDIIYFSLPDSEIQRSLVVIEKISPCPGRYPRKAGTPQKEPIL